MLGSACDYFFFKWEKNSCDLVEISLNPQISGDDSKFYPSILKTVLVTETAGLTVRASHC